jgi:hypothetical protein
MKHPTKETLLIWAFAVAYTAAVGLVVFLPVWGRSLFR